MRRIRGVIITDGTYDEVVSEVLVGRPGVEVGGGRVVGGVVAVEVDVVLDVVDEVVDDVVPLKFVNRLD
jgi:hypothetical protein